MQLPLTCLSADSCSLSCCHYSLSVCRQRVRPLVSWVCYYYFWVLQSRLWTGPRSFGWTLKNTMKFQGHHCTCTLLSLVTRIHGVTKRCRLSWLTNIALVYEPNAGVGDCVVSAKEYSCARGAQINFGDLTPYLTYARNHNVFFYFRVPVLLDGLLFPAVLARLAAQLQANYFIFLPAFLRIWVIEMLFGLLKLKRLYFVFSLGINPP